jgi:hypothetical protein
MKITPADAKLSKGLTGILKSLSTTLYNEASGQNMVEMTGKTV